VRLAHLVVGAGAVQVGRNEIVMVIRVDKDKGALVRRRVVAWRPYSNGCCCRVVVVAVVAAICARCQRASICRSVE
jgi:hypothetical protein